MAQNDATSSIPVEGVAAELSTTSSIPSTTKNRRQKPRRVATTFCDGLADHADAVERYCVALFVGKTSTVDLRCVSDLVQARALKPPHSSSPPTPFSGKPLILSHCGATLNFCQSLLGKVNIGSPFRRQGARSRGLELS